MYQDHQREREQIQAATITNELKDKTKVDTDITQKTNKISQINLKIQRKWIYSLKIPTSTSTQDKTLTALKLKYKQKVDSIAYSSPRRTFQAS